MPEIGDVILAVSGVVILILTLVDFAYTTIGGSGAGPLSRRVSRLAWLAVAGSKGWAPATVARRAVGPVVMSVTALFWIAMTCAGWLLVFRSGTPAVVVSETDAPADWAQTLAFVGSALSTVGASNAQASNTFWDNVAMVAAVNGMVVLTLSVTFVLNVTQTVVKGRGFAALVRSYDLNRGANDDVILPQLANLCFQLKAFPLAVYYSAERTESSIPHTMVWIAESLAHDPSRFERYRGFMKELSGLHVDRETNTAGFLDGLRNWAARSSLD